MTTNERAFGGGGERTIPPVGQPITPDPDPLLEMMRKAVRDGIAVALSQSVWRDVADRVRAEYTGGGLDDIRTAIRQAVTDELRRTTGTPNGHGPAEPLDPDINDIRNNPDSRPTPILKLAPE